MRPKMKIHFIKFWNASSQKKFSVPYLFPETVEARSVSTTPVNLRARELAESSTPLWYMLIAITPRIRYRAGARCPAWRATELRQLCANLLNSNLTGSHLPPLVRAARSYLVRQVVPPGIELYRRFETARRCTRRDVHVYTYILTYIARAGSREIGESVCWKKQITNADSKMIFYSWERKYSRIPCKWRPKNYQFCNCGRTLMLQWNVEENSLNVMISIIKLMYLLWCNYYVI